DAPRDVGGEVEARGVGEVDVLEEEGERPVRCRPADRADGGLEEAGALELGRDGDRRGRVVGGELRREAGDLARPRRGLRGRRQLAGEVAEELRPQAERGRAAEVERAGGRGAGALLSGAV